MSHQSSPQDTPPLTLASLASDLNPSNTTDDRNQLLKTLSTLQTYLSKPPNPNCNPVDHEAAVLLRKQVVKAILPPTESAERSPYSAEEKPELTSDAIANEQTITSKGLSILSILYEAVTLSPDESTDLFTCLTSFSDTNDLWTSSRIQEQASSLVKKCFDPDLLPGLLERLLQERVKPLFAKTKNPAITRQGRRAIDPLLSNATAHGDLDVESKPWKYRDMYIVTVFQWVLTRLDETTIEANWPLIMPPLLALIDDTSAKYKAKGCNLLTTFLRKCPSPLLDRTGLGEVFENAVMPCLMHLPFLTEEAESLVLLKAAYLALIALAAVRFPDEKQKASRIMALDRIFRYGIMKGYAYAGEYVKIAEVLVHQISTLIDEMGIASVKHLKHILPLLSSNLATPFATAYPPLIQASLAALRAAIINDWPQISRHRGEILRGLAVCWCRIEDQEVVSVELEDVRKAIQHTLGLLTHVLRTDVNVEEEYQMLIDSDSRLRNLFTI